MTKAHLAAGVLLVLVALAASALIYPRLPDRIPTHWNFRGEIDRYGPKATVFILPAAMVLTLVSFVWVLPWISPRHYEVETFRSTYSFIALTVVGLCAYMHFVSLWGSTQPPLKLDRALAGGLFVFVALLGNVLGKVRRNFWIGVRTPWTLADERVWDATHRFTARLFVATGILGLIATLAGSPATGFGMLIAAALVSVIYSLVYSKRLDKAASS